MKELLENKKLVEKLAKLIPVEQIPQQHRSHFLRQIAEKFGGRMTAEQLDGLDQLLAEF